jgi:hypothetical protein
MNYLVYVSKGSGIDHVLMCYFRVITGGPAEIIHDHEQYSLLALTFDLTVMYRGSGLPARDWVLICATRRVCVEGVAVDFGIHGSVKVKLSCRSHVQAACKTPNLTAKCELNSILRPSPRL